MERTITLKSSTRTSDAVLLIIAGIFQAAALLLARLIYSICLWLDGFYERVMNDQLSIKEVLCFMVIGAFISQILSGFGIHP